MRRIKPSRFALFNRQMHNGSEIVDVTHSKDVRLRSPHIPADHQPAIDHAYSGGLQIEPFQVRTTTEGLKNNLGRSRMDSPALHKVHGLLRRG